METTTRKPTIVLQEKDVDGTNLTALANAIPASDKQLRCKVLIASREQHYQDYALKVLTDPKVRAFEQGGGTKNLIRQVVGLITQDLIAAHKGLHTSKDAPFLPTVL